MSVNKNRLRNKNQKVTFKKIIFQKKNTAAAEIQFRGALCFLFFKNNFLKGTFCFFYEGNVHIYAKYASSETF